MAWQQTPITAGDAYQTRKQFDTFWRQVCNLNTDHADPSGHKSFEHQLSGRAFPEGREFARIHTPRALRFKGVKARRRGTSNDAYDLYVQAEQILRAATNDDDERRIQTVKSTVKLLYIESRSNPQIRQEERGLLDPPRCYRGFHFDTSAQAFHPLFHAQVDHSCIDHSAIGRRYLVREGDQRLDVPRVPIAPLDFAGVVAMIAQDHLIKTGVSSEERRDAMRQLRSAARELPRFSEEMLPYTPENDDPVPCAVWYPH